MLNNLKLARRYFRKVCKTNDKYTKNNERRYGDRIILFIYVYIPFLLIKLFADLDYFSNVLSSNLNFYNDPWSRFTRNLPFKETVVTFKSLLEIDQ